MVKRQFNEAESYGWVVNDLEAREAYDFACDYFGKEELDSQIVRCLGDEELAKCLAFIFRMNEFDEWENRDTEDEFDESIKRNNRRMKEGYELPYVLWVLDGDSKQWEMYKGITDAKKFIQENDWEELLDALNKQVFPNETYYNNYIDWVVLPAGQHPKDGGTNKFYGEIMPKYESTKRESRRSRRSNVRTESVRRNRKFRRR